MHYVATNDTVHHLTETEGLDGTTLCGWDYTGETASVVTQQPIGTTTCPTCQEILGGRG